VLPRSGENVVLPWKEIVQAGEESLFDAAFFPY
jgi:hypothetical protein